ncbi:MAG: hypothetical protein GY751_20130 [Bacteroidetes bacterium]|nr:hypothetical protein [Bacteroidota bacterium]
MRLTLFILLAVMMTLPTTSFASGEWALARDKDDIKVYMRKYNDYNYKEYKGVTMMNGSVDDIVAILKDMSKYHLWAYNCIENTAVILKEDNSKGEYYIYMEIKAPLVANRDVVAYYKFNPPAADGSVLIEFRGDADFIPKKKGKVRIPEMKGYWKITPMGDGKIKVVTQAFSHPGGNPPASMVNGQTTNAPHHMLKQIRSMIR